MECFHRNTLTENVTDDRRVCVCVCAVCPSWEWVWPNEAEVGIRIGLVALVERSYYQWT